MELAQLNRDATNSGWNMNPVQGYLNNQDQSNQGVDP